MRKKILTMMLVALFVTAGAVVSVLLILQQKATKRTFDEQLNTLVHFAVDNVQLGLRTGEMAAVKATLERLETFSVLKGVILFDEDLTSLMAIPAEFELPDSAGTENLGEWQAGAGRPLL